MRSIFGWMRCDKPGCHNGFFGTNEEARNHGWYAYGQGGLNSSTIHLCPEHYSNDPVQNSGHTPKETPMPVNTRVVSAQNAKDFISLRDEIVSILSTTVYYKDAPVSDLEGFDDAEWSRAAEELMARVSITLIQTDDV